MLSDKLVHFHQISKFFTFVNTYSEIFCTILVSFEFLKFHFHNLKVMAKDKKVNIAVTHSCRLSMKHCVGQMSIGQMVFDEKTRSLPVLQKEFVLDFKFFLISSFLSPVLIRATSGTAYI
jgi:hypothetical protein